MPRYVALLRGVSPMNLTMANLRRALEQAGYSNVVTILGTGNVAFDAPSRSAAKLEHDVENAIEQGVKHRFGTLVRSSAHLRKLLATEPFTPKAPAKGAKRVVTFLRKSPTQTLPLPLDLDGAVIHAVRGAEVFTSYVVNEKGPVFMRLIEKTFGKDVTTRTWATVERCAKA